MVLGGTNSDGGRRKKPDGRALGMDVGKWCPVRISCKTPTPGSGWGLDVDVALFTLGNISFPFLVRSGNVLTHWFTALSHHPILLSKIFSDSVDSCSLEHLLCFCSGNSIFQDAYRDDDHALCLRPVFLSYPWLSFPGKAQELTGCNKLFFSLSSNRHTDAKMHEERR